jgi:hypothetical protein
MNVSYRTIGCTLLSGALLMTPVALRGQATPEVFSATASAGAAGGAEAATPVTITIDRTMPEGESGPLVAAFKSGGADALRKALEGVAPTGSVRIGAGPAVPTRFTVDRRTPDGRLLTILTDQPLSLAADGAPGAKPQAGYDFAVIDIEVDSSGNGAGTLVPAAKIRLNQDAFVVENAGGGVVRLTAVKKSS